MQPLVIISAIIALTSGYSHNGNNLGLQGSAQYRFEYGVNDPQTGDIKSQSEQRDGQQLTGQYTLREADGTRRVVRYRAGPQSGIEAVVERVGQAQHPAQLGQGNGFHQGYQHGYGNGNNFAGVGGSSYVRSVQRIGQGFGGQSFNDQGFDGRGFNEHRFTGQNVDEQEVDNEQY